MNSTQKFALEESLKVLCSYVSNYVLNIRISENSFSEKEKAKYLLEVLGCLLHSASANNVEEYDKDVAEYKSKFTNAEMLFEKLSELNSLCLSCETDSKRSISSGGERVIDVEISSYALVFVEQLVETCKLLISSLNDNQTIHSTTNIAKIISDLIDVLPEKIDEFFRLKEEHAVKFPTDVTKKQFLDFNALIKQVLDEMIGHANTTQHQEKYLSKVANTGTSKFN